MPILFGVDIANIVNDEIAPGLLPATLHVVTRGTRTGSSTAGVKPTEVSLSGRGIKSSFSANLIDGTIIRKEDVQILIITNSFTAAINPKSGDKLTIEGSIYRIISADRDPAGATFTCHCRK